MYGSWIKPIALTVSACLSLSVLTLSSAQAQQRSTLNFRDAEIQAVIDDVSLLTGYTFIVDPDVHGRVTISSQSALTGDEVFQVFLSTLRVNGFATISRGSGVFEIIPEQEGAGAGVRFDPDRNDEVFTTAVIRLSHASARDAIRALEPMLSSAGSANAVEGSNLVVIVDYASNIQAVQQALLAMDRDNSKIEILVLENVAAQDMIRIVERLRTRKTQGEDDSAAAVSVAAVPASNTLLLRGEPKAVAQMMALSRRIDALSESNQSFRVINLNHAEGETLLPILDQFSTAMTDSQAGEVRNTTIAFHAPTNSIIVNGQPDVLRELEQVVRRLDIRRPQVQVEAIIVEISDRTAKELGAQLLLAGDDANATPLLNTKFKNQKGPDLLSLTGALATDAFTTSSPTTAQTSLSKAALSSLLGSTGGTFGIGGSIGDNGALFGVIINAIEQDADSNILSKPQIMVLDNEEAELVVGQEIPITTGESLGADNSNPFRQIKRESVGVKLFVHPQINEGDTIRLRLRQEVSSIAGPVSKTSEELITNQREFQTTVLADDGEIIVLGGLMERDLQYANDAVPGFSRIPLAGRLFKNEQSSEVRRNLMVFIRPTIVRDVRDMRDVTRTTYDIAVNEQERATGYSNLEEMVDLMIGDRDPFSSSPEE